MPAPLAVAAPNAPTSAPANVAPPAPVAKPDVAAVEAEFELKVDGQMRKFKRADAERALSKASYADKVVQQAKEALKAIKAREEELEKQRAADSDPDELLRSRKHDPEAYARKVLERKLAEAQMSPEQRMKAEYEAKLSEAEGKLKAVEDERTQGKQTALQAQLQQQMENQLAAAAERAGIPRDADSFYAIFEAVKEWHQAGLPFDAERIAETAKENIENGFKRLEGSVLKGLKGQALEDRLGKTVVDELLRHKTKMLREGKLKPPSTAQAVVPRKQDAAPKYISPSEAREMMRGLGK